MHGLVDIKFDDWLSPHTLQVDKTKPILRRTEDITDEECISINKISPLFVAGTSEKYINDRLYTIREYAIHQRHRPEVFHFLIKQSFDVFGLIESGQAIDAKTIS